MDGQRQNNVNSNFVSLTICYLYPEILKTLSNFTLSEIINYFIEAVAADEITATTSMK